MIHLLDDPTDVRVSELDAAMDGLFEIVGRAVEGEPPVTEAEYAELAAWFAAHAAELAALGAWSAKTGGSCGT